MGKGGRQLEGLGGVHSGLCSGVSKAKIRESAGGSGRGRVEGFAFTSP